nr:xylulose kinase-1 [Tanacetum cinerariifolium]
MSDHEDETITAENAPPKNTPRIIIVTNIFAKFSYLKKGEYDIWAMKMQNFISSSDLLCWNIVLKGNSAKSMTIDKDGNMKIRPHVTAEEHQQVQREEKARTILLSVLPDEHMGDFYHMIDARDIWNTIKARFGGNAESKKMQKSLVIPAGVSVSAGDVAVAVVSPHSETEFAFMGYSTEVYIPVTCPLYCDSKYKLIEKDYQGQREQLNDCVVDLKAHKHDVKSLEKQIKCHQTNQLAYEEKIKVLSYELEENGKNLYKLIDSSMSVRTKRGLGLDKYIGEGELGIDDSKFSIFHTNSDELEGQPIYNSDRSSKPSTNDFQTCDYSQECSRPNHSDHDSNDFIFSVSAPTSESRDTIVIDCARQEDFPSVCTSSIETDVKYSNTLCNKFGSFNKESHFRKHKSVTSKSCYVCGSYLHLIKDCDLHEQRLVKRNTEGKGKLGRRPTGKPINLNRPKPVSACQPNPVSDGKATLACNSIPLSVSAEYYVPAVSSSLLLLASITAVKQIVIPSPPPLSFTGTSGSGQQQGSKALTGLYGTQELSPTDSVIPGDSIPNEQKPLPTEERPATPEPTWTIPSSNVSDVENNWATALALTYVTPAENSLLVKTRDMTNFLNWYCRQLNKTKLTQVDLEGQAYEVVKAFYPYVINLQFQMEECH